ncbi:uncharacterized protein [Macrobrachium rosenbergii]|uniref:uncharacterized protein n=1 Tax=Macrobrachium rosenbergii TaxID=79674 RepID=UPI0034D7359B
MFLKDLETPRETVNNIGEFNGMTHKGSIRQSYGGVGRNLGDALARLKCHPLLVSAVGTDIHARSLTSHNPLMDCRGLARLEGAATATYCAVLDSEGEALFGIGDMTIHDYVTPEHVKKFEAEMAVAPLVILDGNMSLETIGYVLDHCASCSVPVWYEPTDIQKATKPWLTGRGHSVSFSSPNLNELRALCSHLDLGEIALIPEDKDEMLEHLPNILKTTAPLLEHMKGLMITMGKLGFMIIRKSTAEGINEPLLRANDNKKKSEVFGLYFPGERNLSVASVSGAGDCLAAGFICGMLHGKSVSECSALGHSAAASSLKSAPAVPDTISFESLPWGTERPFMKISC